jgi:hypothetical protein
VIQVIVRIVGAAVVADPVIAVDVGDVGMAGSVSVMTVLMLLRGATLLGSAMLLRRAVIGLWTALRRGVHLMSAGLRSGAGMAALRMAFAWMLLPQYGECEE